MNEEENHASDEEGDITRTSTIQATIKVHGKVQQVGYRRKVNHFAQGLDRRGFVGNLEDPSAKDEKHQPVGIICQGPRDKIETFLKLIEITNGYIDVEKMEVSYEETFAMRFPDFCIHREEAKDEIGPRMDTAIRILSSMDEGIHTGNMELKEEIRKGNTELKEGIKTVAEKIDTGFERTSQHFHQLDGKYHTVSEDLKGIRRAVERKLMIEEERAGYSVDRKDRE